MTKSKVTIDGVKLDTGLKPFYSHRVLCGYAGQDYTVWVGECGRSASRASLWVEDCRRDGSSRRTPKGSKAYEALSEAAIEAVRTANY